MHILQWLDGTQKFAYAIIVFLLIVGIVNPLVVAYSLEQNISISTSAALTVVFMLLVTFIFLHDGMKVIRALEESEVDVNTQRIHSISIFIMASAIGQIMIVVGVFMAGVLIRSFYAPLRNALAYALWTLGELTTSATQILAFKPE